MKTSSKRLTACAAMLAVAAVAGAQDQSGPQRFNRNQAGFNCPVCDSPCINRTALQRQLRQQWMQNQHQPQVRRNRQPSPPHRQWQGQREKAAYRTEQQNRRQEPGRFDIDGDGQLSHAEKAARRAYRDALDRQRVEPNDRPAPQPQVE